MSLMHHLIEKNNIDENLLCANVYLYDKPIITVQINGSTGRGFRRTAGGRQDVFFHAASSTNFFEMIYVLRSGRT